MSRDSEPLGNIPAYLKDELLRTEDAYVRVIHILASVTGQTPSEAIAWRFSRLMGKLITEEE